MENKKISCNCFGGVFSMLLTLLFVWAKLVGYIDWSWWIVFCPIWISALFCILVMITFITIKVFLEK